MKKVLFILSLFFTSISFAQLENTNWCFGEHAKVVFNPVTPTAPPSASSCAINNNPAGTSGYSGSGSSVSDANGQVLFYTDALSIWDKNNNEMPGGTQLFGTTDQFAGKNNSVIVPKPDHPGVYYVFTISTFVTGAPAFGRGGVHYTVVNTNLAGAPGPSAPNGDVISGLKNIALKNENSIPLDFDYGSNTGLRTYSTKIATTLHAGLDKVWVTIFTQYNQTGISELHALNYLITANGFYDGTMYYPDGTSPMPMTSLTLDNTIHNETMSTIYGEIKISANGQHLSDINDNCVVLYNFNNQTGVIGYDRTVFIGGAGNPWGSYPTNGVEFSPDNNFLYFTAGDNIFQNRFSNTASSNRSRKYVRIFQYALTKNTTEQIGQIEIIDSSQGGPIDHIITPLPVTYPCGLQIGIDHKIYACVSYPIIGQLYYLGIIQQPNVPSTGCQFIVNGLQLQSPTSHLLTLPHWVHRPVNVWPKVYSYINGSDPGPFPAVGYSSLAIGNGSSLFYGFTTHNMTINTNHNGGTVPTAPGAYTVQYNKSSGITSWIQPNMFPKFVLSTGEVQMLTSLFSPVNTLITTVFVDPTTGNITTGPSVAPTNEIILAEDNGTYLTRSTTSLHVRSQSGNTSTSFINGAASIIKTVYNAATKHLFIQYKNSSDAILPLAVYSLNNNTLTLINTLSQNTLAFMQQVNSLDEVFMFYLVGNTGTLRIEKYDFISDTHVPVTIPGFNNADLDFTRSSNPYAEDKLMETQMTEHNIYALNTISLQEKKIPYITQFGSSNLAFGYWFDGDDLYMEVGADNQLVTVGNQTISPLGGASIGVTKFNILTDFSLRTHSEDLLAQQNISSKAVEKNKIVDLKPASSINATLSPNPAKNSLIINLKRDNSKAAALSFLISITNSLGVVMFTQSTQQNRLTIDVAAFKTGTYYVTISTGKGDKLTRVFMKE